MLLLNSKLKSFENETSKRLNKEEEMIKFQDIQSIFEDFFFILIQNIMPDILTLFVIFLFYLTINPLYALCFLASQIINFAVLLSYKKLFVQKVKDRLTFYYDSIVPNVGSFITQLDSINMNSTQKQFMDNTNDKTNQYNKLIKDHVDYRREMLFYTSVVTLLVFSLRFLILYYYFLSNNLISKETFIFIIVMEGKVRTAMTNFQKTIAKLYYIFGNTWALQNDLKFVLETNLKLISTTNKVCDYYKNSSTNTTKIIFNDVNFQLPNTNSETPQFSKNIHVIFSADDNSQIIKIQGPSGVGKTTLFKLLVKIFPTNGYQGNIFFDGRLIDCWDNDEIRKRIVFMENSQDQFLDDNSSVRENIIYKRNEEIKQEFIEDFLSQDILKIFNGDLEKQIGNSSGSSLSTGQKKMIMLLRAIVSYNQTYDVLILDEPFANLDDENVSIVKDLLTRLKTNPHKTKDGERTPKHKLIIIIDHSVDDVKNEKGNTSAFYDKVYKISQSEGILPLS